MQFLGNSTIKDRDSKISFLNKEDLQVYLIYQSNQPRMNVSTKFGNIWINRN